MILFDIFSTGNHRVIESVCLRLFGKVSMKGANTKLHSVRLSVSGDIAPLTGRRTCLIALFLLLVASNTEKQTSLILYGRENKMQTERQPLKA